MKTFAIILVLLAAPFMGHSSGDTNAPAAVHPPAHVATPEERAAQLKALYDRLVPKLPPGTVTVLDQPYVDNSVKGISPDSSQMLDLFVPPGAGPFPLVVWIHGGGWHGGGKEGGLVEAPPYLNHGFAVAGITYRWTQDAPFPAQMEDCNDAIGWLRAHAEQYHLDPNEVGVFGHSAGGHLCALLAATGDGTAFKNPQKVQAAVCYAGVYDLDRDRGKWPKNYFMWNPRDAMASFFPTHAYDKAFAQSASPENYIHAGMAPILMFHGDSDTVVPFGQAQVFANDAKKAGADVTFEVGAGKDHGTVITVEAKVKAMVFFQKYLQHKP